jgi:hypothetical protein
MGAVLGSFYAQKRGDPSEVGMKSVLIFRGKRKHPIGERSFIDFSSITYPVCIVKPYTLQISLY